VIVERPFKTSDYFRVVFAGKGTAGCCVIASDNGRSVMLSFEDFLGGYLGRMPVLMNEGGELHELFRGRLVGLSRVKS
jgi:hypothetical protein